jgi:hypothetical protein
MLSCDIARPVSRCGISRDRRTDLTREVEVSVLSSLPLFVHLNRDRTLDPVGQDSSFPEKQESQTALVLSSAATVRSAWSGMPAFPQE